jgi:hypothetical protein
MGNDFKSFLSSFGAGLDSGFDSGLSAVGDGFDSSFDSGLSGFGVTMVALQFLLYIGRRSREGSEDLWKIPVEGHRGL